MEALTGRLTAAVLAQDADTCLAVVSAYRVEQARCKALPGGDTRPIDLDFWGAFEAVTPEIVAAAVRRDLLPGVESIVARSGENSHRDFTLTLADGTEADLDVKTTEGQRVTLETVNSFGGLGWFPRMAESSVILSLRIHAGGVQALWIPVSTLRRTEHNGLPWWANHKTPDKQGRVDIPNAGERGLFHVYTPPAMLLQGAVDLTPAWCLS